MCCCAFHVRLCHANDLVFRESCFASSRCFPSSGKRKRCQVFFLKTEFQFTVALYEMNNFPHPPFFDLFFSVI